MAKHRVLVVDDSFFMRKIISDIVNEDGRFEVIDTAKNGLEAVEKTKRLQPDVITMDIEMPEMNGLEALKTIMAERPTPVVMLSSLTRAGARETIVALEWGAVDFVCKPSGPISLDLAKVKSELLEKLSVAAQTNVRRYANLKWLAPDVRAQPAKAAAHTAFKVPQVPLNEPASERIGCIVAIGTSTGGPRALQYVVSRLPAHFPAPVVIVQHMPPNFTRSLAQRLDACSQLRVAEAEDGVRLENGHAYVAPGGWHMTVRKDEPGVYRIRLSKEEPRSGHRPSVDMLFESLVPLRELKRYAVLMTGMGSDGAKGMQALHRAGALATIAESAETCVVYGMPRAAVELNCVKHLLPLHHIPQKLTELMQSENE